MNLQAFCKTKINYGKFSAIYEWDLVECEAKGTVKDVMTYLIGKDCKASFEVKCPGCGKVYTVQGLNALSLSNFYCNDCNSTLLEVVPELSKYWVSTENNLTPDKILVRGYENKLYVVKCPICGKHYSKKKGEIITDKDFICDNCKALQGKSLFVLYPEVAVMFDKGYNDVTSKEVFAHSNKKYNFVCENGHSFIKSINGMVRKEALNSKSKGCPYCSGTLLVKENSFGYVYPRVSSLWDYEKNGNITPMDVSKGSGKKFWFKCPKGHEFYTSPNSLGRAEGSKYLGCKECATEVIDLVSKEPNIAKYWDKRNSKLPYEVKYDPQGVNSDILYWLHCDKGHLYQQSACKIIKGFRNGVKNCPVCSGQFLQEGVNDLETLNSDVAKYWDYDKNSFTPKEVTPFSHKMAWFKCIECNKSIYMSVNDRSKSAGYCPDCATKFYQSLAEKEIISWLKEKGYNVNTSLTLGSKHYKYDIYIADKSLVIEYNGLYWHSEVKHPDRYYHYNKYKTCKDNGLVFYAIWEDDYKRNPDLVKKAILRKLGDSNERKINARDCKVGFCSKVDAYEFLEDNHIQGFCDMCSYKGLYSNDELVGVVAYVLKDGVLNIKRYATNCILRGGFSKVLKALENIDGVTAIETFSDNAVSDGSLYRNMGFSCVKDIKPDYAYLMSGRRRIHKFNLRKDAFKRDSKLAYNPDYTESQLAEINKLYKIWDYGKKKWVKYLI